MQFSTLCAVHEKQTTHANKSHSETALGTTKQGLFGVPAFPKEEIHP